MHPALATVAEAARGTPFENQLWLVGGAVRDELLSLGEGEASASQTDFDIVLEGDALALARLLREKGASSIAPVVYPRFGTAMVHVAGSNVELVTARRESYEATSRKPNVEPATLYEDAQRRDFTVNTLMRNLHTGELRDPLGVGLRDLEARVLRTPVDPSRTFYDDPLRMLRAVRFRWKLGFAPAQGLYEAIANEAYRLGSDVPSEVRRSLRTTNLQDDGRGQSASELAQSKDVVSAERIRDEWVKMLLHPTASSAMRDLMSLGLLDQFAPEFLAMEGVDQGRYHHLDVWEHTLLVVNNLRQPRTLTLTLAALLHDIGKPSTWSADYEANIRFYGHETVGAEMAEKMLRRLKFSNEDIAPVVSLVKNHMRLGSFKEFTPTAARRLLRDMGDLLEPLFDLVEADAASLRPGVRVMDLAPIRARVAEVSALTPATSLESPLRGNEIMAMLNLAAGPEVGRIKQAILNEVLEGRIDPGDKAAAQRFLKQQST